MVCGQGEAAHHATAVLIDFGLARRTDGQDDEDDGGGGEVSPGGTLTLTLASTLTLTPTLTLRRARGASWWSTDWAVFSSRCAA